MNPPASVAGNPAQFRRDPAADSSPGGPSPRGAKPGAPDLALLLAASLALILPGWLTSPRAAPLGLSGVCEAPRRIDINAAAWYEWTLLEGVGETRARRIVEARGRRGGFSSLEELEEVPGLPRGWLERVRPFLTVGKRARQPMGADATMETEDGR